MPMRKGDVTEQHSHKNFFVSAHDPYGFWYVTRDGAGALPAELNQVFTNRVAAEQAIDAAMERKDREVEEKAKEALSIENTTALDAASKRSLKKAESKEAPVVE